MNTRQIIHKKHGVAHPPTAESEISNRRAIDREQKAFDALHAAINVVASLSAPLAHIGDGSCGYILNEVKQALASKGLYSQESYGVSTRAKRKISQTLRAEVFERDKYRCLRCGDHKDLCVDHVVPESKGGSNCVINLQTLCRPCNSWKEVRAIDYRDER